MAGRRACDAWPPGARAASAPEGPAGSSPEPRSRERTGQNPGRRFHRLRETCAAKPETRHSKFETTMFDQLTLDRHGLKPDEYARIVTLLGREPNLTELGIFSVMWSEHCSYKSSRVHLKTLPTEGRACCRVPVRTPARSISATAWRPCSRSNRTTTRLSSSRTRAQPPASGASSATSSRWARGPVALLNALRFGPLERRTDAPHARRGRRRHRRIRQQHRHPDHRRRSRLR